MSHIHVPTSKLNAFVKWAEGQLVNVGAFYAGKKLEEAVYNWIKTHMDNNNHDYVETRSSDSPQGYSLLLHKS